MKIGDEVYIHGYIDEIRKEVVIIHNEGGYFGTLLNEINYSENLNNCEDAYPCNTCKNNKLEWFSEICDGCCRAHSNYEPRKTNKAEKKQPTPILDFMINGRVKNNLPTDNPCENCNREDMDRCWDCMVYCIAWLSKWCKPQTDCAWKGDK